MSRGDSTSEMAHRLLAANEEQIDRLAPLLVERVRQEFGSSTDVDGYWPVDLVHATREFLVCVAANDFDRLGRRSGPFYMLGSESARGGVDFERLAAALRRAARLATAQVHRILIADGIGEDTESVVRLLDRVAAGGEEMIMAAHQGYTAVGLADDEDEVARRVASRLLRGTAPAPGLVTELGWHQDQWVCVVLAGPEDAVRIRRDSGRRVAYFTRKNDVVLIVPVDEGKLATTLRRSLQDVRCTVGPAVRFDDVRSSVDLAHRTAALTSAGSGAAFADDVLLELACSTDVTLVAALRRKYSVTWTPFPRSSAHSSWTPCGSGWLQWGYRPGIARTLGVHPQTVSGRMQRVKDLLADDLDDPIARAELLVLLVADRTEVTGATRPRELPTTSVP